MSSQDPPNGIILFHYTRSPYARRVRWYLAFRHIAYAECIQPPIMPRPDLRALGVKYRRTPSMAIGRDVYIDTRMIIQRLDQLFPPSTHHPAFSSPEIEGLAKLLNKLVIDASLFSNAVSIMPPEASALRDPAFLKDRADFYGEGWRLESLLKIRHEGLVHLRECFGIVEALLADGRKWIGATQKPSLADLEGESSRLWAIDWVLSDLGAPMDLFGETSFPKIHRWRKDFKTELDKELARAPKVAPIAGKDAVKSILAADFSDNDLVFDAGDPFKMQEGALVELFPTDGGGFTHKDIGRLVKLTPDEVAIAVRSEDDETEVHLHAPRWKFRIKAIEGSAKL